MCVEKWQNRSLICSCSSDCTPLKGANPYKYAGKDLHMIFGWLQVGQILRVGKDEVPAELRHHPHVVRSFIVRNELGARSEDNNTLYLARERLTFAPEIPGAGVFGRFDVTDFDDPRRWTHGTDTCSRWRLPSFFARLSNMGEQPAPMNGSWYPQRRGPGQEFVLDATKCAAESADWLDRVFKHAAKTQAVGRA